MGATYPNGIIPWVNRVDNVNTVFADDPNSLASEVIAIESTVGTNPHIETAPPVGNPITYSNVSSRIHDVQLGGQIPVCTLAAPGTSPFYVPASSDNISEAGVPSVGGVPGYINSYRVLYDPFGFYNGNDITIPANGWYIISLMQRVYWWSSGVVQLFLMTATGNETAADFWNWSFPENQAGGVWLQRNRFMACHWQGGLTKGDRVFGVTWNGTTQAQMKVDQAYLKISWVRAMPPNTLA